MTKTKKKLHDYYSKEEAETFVADYSEAASQLKKTSAEMELRINSIRQEYQSTIDDLTEKKDAAVDKLHHFALCNPEYFEKKKSMEFVHGKIGFRTGTHKLKLVKGYTWDRVTEKLQSLLPAFVRTKVEPDKDKLLASRDDQDIAKKFEKIGVYVDQDETFFVDNKEEVVVTK